MPTVRKIMKFRSWHSRLAYAFLLPFYVECLEALIEHPVTTAIATTITTATKNTTTTEGAISDGLLISLASGAAFVAILVVSIVCNLYVFYSIVNKIIVCVKAKQAKKVIFSTFIPF